MMSSSASDEGVEAERAQALAQLVVVHDSPRSLVVLDAELVVLAHVVGDDDDVLVAHVRRQRRLEGDGPAVATAALVEQIADRADRRRPSLERFGDGACRAPRRRSARAVG